MDRKTNSRRSSVKTWALVIYIWVFLCIWISGLTAGLMSSACQKDRYEGKKKLRFCNISLAAGGWVAVFPLERVKRSMTRLEKGIALSQLGREREALEAFEGAIRDARADGGPWERNLHRRMARLEDQRALALWASVVGPTE